jgi:sec-independent protein translocase protein TatA
MPTLGGPELLIIVLIVLILFGGSRLANVGKSIGGGFRGFKDGLMGEPAARKEAPVEVARDRK